MTIQMYGYTFEALHRHTNTHTHTHTHTHTYPQRECRYILEANGNATAAIDEATASGLEYVMLLGWSVSDGHYAVNKGVFPDGDAGLKAMVDRLHEAGLKAGMHFLSAHVSKNDPYVTPVPDPGLALDAASSLAYALDSTSTFIPLDTPVGVVPWVSTTWVGTTVSGTPAGATAYTFDTRLAVIGSELVTYVGLASLWSVSAWLECLNT